MKKNTKTFADKAKSIIAKYPYADRSDRDKNQRDSELQLLADEQQAAKKQRDAESAPPEPAIMANGGYSDSYLNMFPDGGFLGDPPLDPEQKMASTAAANPGPNPSKYVMPENVPEGIVADWDGTDANPPTFTGDFSSSMGENGYGTYTGWRAGWGDDGQYKMQERWNTPSGEYMEGVDGDDQAFGSWVDSARPAPVAEESNVAVGWDNPKHPTKGSRSEEEAAYQGVLKSGDRKLLKQFQSERDAFGTDHGRYTDIVAGESEGYWNKFAGGGYTSYAEGDYTDDEQLEINNALNALEDQLILAGYSEAEASVQASRFENQNLETITGKIAEANSYAAAVGADGEEPTGTGGNDMEENDPYKLYQESRGTKPVEVTGEADKRVQKGANAFGDDIQRRAGDEGHHPYFDMWETRAGGATGTSSSEASPKGPGKTPNITQEQSEQYIKAMPPSELKDQLLAAKDRKSLPTMLEAHGVTPLDVERAAPIKAMSTKSVADAAASLQTTDEPSALQLKTNKPSGLTGEPEGNAFTKYMEENAYMIPQIGAGVNAILGNKRASQSLGNARFVDPTTYKPSYNANWYDSTAAENLIKNQGASAMHNLGERGGDFDSYVRGLSQINSGTQASLGAANIEGQRINTQEQGRIDAIQSNANQYNSQQRTAAANQQYSDQLNIDQLRRDYDMGAVEAGSGMLSDMSNKMLAGKMGEYYDWIAQTQTKTK